MGKNGSRKKEAREKEYVVEKSVLRSEECNEQLPPDCSSLSLCIWSKRFNVLIRTVYDSTHSSDNCMCTLFLFLLLPFLYPLQQ